MIELTDEIISMTTNFMRGIEDSEDTLMLDELHAVGPGGQFLDTDATLANFRDFWYPAGLLDRDRRSQWLESGATTLGERLNTRVKEIIKEHRPKPLEEAKKTKLQEILARAAEEV
jgi:trimethylamine:corrinoid methyltransferase-like protein